MTLQRCQPPHKCEIITKIPTNNVTSYVRIPRDSIPLKIALKSASYLESALWSMTQKTRSDTRWIFFRRFSVPTMKIHSTFFSTNKTPPKIERRKMFRIAAKNSDVDANVENV